MNTISVTFQKSNYELRDCTKENNLKLNCRDFDSSLHRKEPGLIAQNPDQVIPDGGKH